MKDAVPYTTNEDDDELRRPGFKDIMTELRNQYARWPADRLRAKAKELWHERNPGEEK